MISEICTHFTSPSKRTNVLKKHLKSLSHTFLHLHKYCETRWVDRHEAMILFSEVLPDIVKLLEVLMDSKTGRYATGLLLHFTLNLCSFSFLVSFAVSKSFLSLTLCLSQYLQGSFVDVNVALEHIDSVLK